MPKSPKTAAEVELEFQNQNILNGWGYSQVNYDSFILFEFLFMLVYFLHIQFDSGNDDPYRFYRGVYRSNATKRSKTFSYCVFASEAIIRMIDANVEVQRRNYFLDATFKVCPLGKFNQFLIIYIEYMETVSLTFTI